MNIQENSYQVKAVLKDGSTLDLTPALLRLSWQDPPEEVAQRAAIQLAQVRTDRGLLHKLLPLCTMIFIIANDAEVFRGIVWEWEYESSTNREITLTCYDHFIYAQNSKTFAYFPEGKSTKDIIGAICGDAGIGLSYKWDSATHDKTVFRGNYVADQILDTLDKAKKKIGGDPVATYEKGTLTIQKVAYNKDIFHFKSGESAMSTNERITLDGLVTKVAIYGAESQDDRRQVEAVLPGKTEYGTLQDIVLRSSSTSLADAKKEAQNILDEHGSPKRTISAEVPDVPQIRKGWKIRMDAGSLSGYFIVKGVTHNATARTMTLELKGA